VIFGKLLVPALYLLARDLFGVRAGIVAALLVAVLPFAVWYSQEARNYSLLMLMTTLQMWFAYRAVKSGRVADWLGLALFTILNLYTHYVALAATAAVALYVLIFVLAGALRGAPAGSAVALAYLPWVPSLLVFLGRPDQSLGQIHVDHPAGLPELANTLGGLSLTGSLLIALGGGLVALGVWAFRGKAAESLLVLLWLAVPLAIFGYSAGRSLLAIDSRYLAFLVPAALTVIGLAVEALSAGAERLAAGMRRPKLSPPRVGAVAGG